MPLYEYECDDCRHRFEVIQKIADPPIARCPKCGAAVHKLQSAPAFQFKGTGWYVTDYGRKGGDAPPTAEAGAKSDASASGTTDTNSDSKSVPKESSGPSEKTGGSTKTGAATGSSSSGSSTPKN